MRNAKEVSIAHVGIYPIAKSMGRSKTAAEHDAPMPNNTARPDQLRTDGPNIALRDSAQHLVQPQFIESIDGIVEDANYVVLRGFGSVIYQPRKAKFTCQT